MNWTWTFRLGRIWGIDVRVHWSLLLFILWRTATAGRGLPPGWIPFIVGIQLCLFGIVLLHELGHCWAARRSGLHASHIILWPLGGLAMIGGGLDDPKTEIKVALAGPMTNLVLAAPAALVLLLMGAPISPFRPPIRPLSVLLLNFFMELNLILLLFNLIPCFPMDGGRALRALLTMKMGRPRASVITAKIAMGLCVVMALYGLASQHFFLILIAVFIGFQAYREHQIYSQAARSGAGVEMYWRGQRISMGRGGIQVEPQRRSRPGWLQRYRTRRATKKWLKQKDRVEKMKLSVDEILDKMNEVGFEGLTPEEQRILREASKLSPEDDDDSV